MYQIPAGAAEELLWRVPEEEIELDQLCSRAQPSSYVHFGPASTAGC